MADDFDWRNTPLRKLPWDDNGDDEGEAPVAQTSNPSMTPEGGQVQIEDTRPDDDGKPPIPCVVGPCRYFQEIAQVEGSIGAPGRKIETRRLFRYCHKLQEDPGTMVLNEITIRYCSRYAPPIWSAGGWVQRLRMAPLQMRGAKLAHTSPTLGVRILCVASKALGGYSPGKQWTEEAERLDGPSK